MAVDMGCQLVEPPPLPTPSMQAAPQSTTQLNSHSAAAQRGSTDFSGRWRVDVQFIEERLPMLLVAVAVVWTLWQGRAEVVNRAPLLNDGVMHLLALERTVEALRTGQDA